MTDTQQGKLKSENGTEYEGEHKNNIPHGKGTSIYADGNKYTGEWKDGKRHGKVR